MSETQKNYPSVSAYLEELAYDLLGLRPAMSPDEERSSIFINDIDNIVKRRIQEYRTWYTGDSDLFYAFYSEERMTEFPSEPYYWKNKQSYFWAEATREKNMKRTHSGFARAMIDTLVSVCGTPVAKAGKEMSIDGTPAEKVLNDLLEADGFWSLYRQKQMPLTLVDGWGAFKISWDTSLFGSDPVVYYYPAENVRVYRRGNRVFGITFLDYVSAKEGGTEATYMVAETRAIGPDGIGHSRYDMFKKAGTTLSQIDAIPGYRKPVPWDGLPCLFAEPCSFYSDIQWGYPGRSILQGKLDALDDLDQALSQESNTVRRSTPVELFNTDYCDRDEHGVPILPDSFDRKYVQIRGLRGPDGSTGTASPVITTQPNLNTSLYDSNIESLERLIVTGHLSPATMGLDIAKKDNAAAQREKEKVTVFTRNHLCREESRILSSLFNQLLTAKQFLVEGTVSNKPADWQCKAEFDEFSDESYESKIEALSSVLADSAISPSMFVDKVYGNSISEEKAEEEKNWLEQQRTRADRSMQEEEEEPVAAFGDEERG